MLESIAWLNECGIIDLIGIIVSPIISIIILWLTLKHDKKQFRIQIQKQEKEHRENIEKTEQQHKQLLKQQKEENRIAAMPYFVMDKKIDTYFENETLYFTISFTNEGNGTAIELTGKYIAGMSKDYLCPMCETISAIYGCGCPFDYETNVANPKGTCRFDMYQKRNAENQGDMNIDEVTFSILFKDMYLNLYEQQFMFIFGQSAEDRSIRIMRVSVGTPALTETAAEEN
ncbi:hypothetical protein SAMN02745248_01241 [Hathewaya proteolytica DSM 3090]|uniref:Uncharacterized protein n=1 Tax=Hathewaya proteolytica DSM 3090 TaxID=1121331 RepID=A0A1M6N2T4_9CLOT|nr:hypothetical protein [Hathewaya proteolytica]SHJ89985.1 hypothetical protein SAMN02745248_01241 [Hathewaya proteolytica DSM 3090]